ncbi:hypothetical protein VYU27_010556, partial [Nannochloropsis oceanica]
GKVTAGVIGLALARALRGGGPLSEKGGRGEGGKEGGREGGAEWSVLRREARRWAFPMVVVEEEGKEKGEERKAFLLRLLVDILSSFPSSLPPSSPPEKERESVVCLLLLLKGAWEKEGWKEMLRSSGGDDVDLSRWACYVKGEMCAGREDEALR